MALAGRQYLAAAAGWWSLLKFELTQRGGVSGGAIGYRETLGFPVIPSSNQPPPQPIFSSNAHLQSSVTSLSTSNSFSKSSLKYPGQIQSWNHSQSKRALKSQTLPKLKCGEPAIRRDLQWKAWCKPCFSGLGANKWGPSNGRARDCEEVAKTAKRNVLKPDMCHRSAGLYKACLLDVKSSILKGKTFHSRVYVYKLAAIHK